MNDFVLLNLNVFHWVGYYTCLNYDVYFTNKIQLNGNLTANLNFYSGWFRKRYNVVFYIANASLIRYNSLINQGNFFALVQSDVFSVAGKMVFE